MKNFNEILEKISRAKKKQRFHEDAYVFLMEALNFTVLRLDAPRHVSGQELLMGIKDYAIKQYGQMSKTVLNYWGIKETKDFGEIVFDLIEAEVLRKQAEDKIEDFFDVYDFDDVFCKSYSYES